MAKVLLDRTGDFTTGDMRERLILERRRKIQENGRA